MNLIELLLLLTMIALGGWLAHLLHPVGGLWLSIPGFALGLLLIPVLLVLHERYRVWAYKGDHHMPDCRCGNNEFRYERVEAKYQLACDRCGTHYEKRRDEVSIFEDGASRPYRRLVKHRGWIDVDESL